VVQRKRIHSLSYFSKNSYAVVLTRVRCRFKITSVHQTSFVLRIRNPCKLILIIFFNSSKTIFFKIIFTVDVLLVQKILCSTNRAGRLRLMGKYVEHRLVARLEQDNTFRT